MKSFHNKRHVVIISPAKASANNGNWQTASRWTRFLRDDYRVSCIPAVEFSDLSTAPDAIIALHARRSAAALAAFAQAYPDCRSALVLTGTDLYHDIQSDSVAQRSLLLANRLVVLQDDGVQILGEPLRDKATVIYQSAPPLKPETRSPNARYFNVTMIGHLRAEKDPATFMSAAALMTSDKVRLTHIGAALDPALGTQAEATQRAYPCYRWLGGLPHAKTRQLLKRSKLMVITSRMEGGANVIVEAITSGVPVIASDISGNRGMLGNDYAGFFPVGDSQALAKLINQAASDTTFYDRLQVQCTARAPLFGPEREKAAVLKLVDNLIHCAS